MKISAMSVLGAYVAFLAVFMVFGLLFARAGWIVLNDQTMSDIAVNLMAGFAVTAFFFVLELKK